MTYALDRSHDQYYFHRPKSIVSDPPRVPTLYLANEVIAQRHTRSLIMSAFSRASRATTGNAGLFSSWGTTGTFVNERERALQKYVHKNRRYLCQRVESVVGQRFRNKINTWIVHLPAELGRAAAEEPDNRRDLLEVLVERGLLPKYAFPVDVVQLAIPAEETRDAPYESQDYYAGISRDLKIALSEYAPGGDILLGRFSNTYIYRVAAVYDPSNPQPDYSPQNRLNEYMRCHAVSIQAIDEPPQEVCGQCGVPAISPMDYLRPRGFSVDQALPEGGRRVYSQSAGRERAGLSSSAKLLVGADATRRGSPKISSAPQLYSLVRTGDLVMSNNGGRGADEPGFAICPRCGRLMDPDTRTHRYPAHVPPHYGDRGPAPVIAVRTAREKRTGSRWPIGSPPSAYCWRLLCLGSWTLPSSNLQAGRCGIHSVP